MTAMNKIVSKILKRAVVFALPSPDGKELYLKIETILSDPEQIKAIKEWLLKDE